ncbi:MAG: phosphate/phosphite/phosphonate ABC transporter substrate-binding protein [Caldilineaceae bacterium]|nr:phosphate/phosphite/phosphonate ABC transporter substrate-binding protein [Caldilineaceae bacterium]
MKRPLFLINLWLLLVFSLSACVVPATPAAPAAAAETTAAHADRADWPATFRMGFFGGDDAEKTLKDNDPFRLYMEEALGIPVELFTGTSYSAVIEAMRAERVEAMLVGPFAYVLAVQEAQAEALAINMGLEADATSYDPDAPTHYYSTIFTKKGSGITTLADLKGKDFTFVDPASTSGHLAPKTTLLKAGINPDTDMKTVFAGSHPSSVLAVWNDQAPAGATYENNLYMLAAEGQIDFCGFPDGKTARKRTAAEIQAVYDACPEGSLVIIAFSDEIPSTPFAIRSTLPDSLKTAVKDALLAIKEDDALVTELASWYVDPSADLGLESLDQYYNSLRDIAKLLDLDLKELAR